MEADVKKRFLSTLAGALLITASLPAVAWADPPQAIPANHTAEDGADVVRGACER